MFGANGQMVLVAWGDTGRPAIPLPSTVILTGMLPPPLPLASRFRHSPGSSPGQTVPEGREAKT